MIDAATLAKALAPRSRPSKESFPELLDVLRVFRLAAGLAAGVVCGLLLLTGWSGFVLYAAIALGGAYVYYTTYVEADVESYGAQALLMEGTQAGLAVCILSWTIVFNALGGGKA